MQKMQTWIDKLGHTNQGGGAVLGYQAFNQRKLCPTKTQNWRPKCCERASSISASLPSSFSSTRASLKTRSLLSVSVILPSSVWIHATGTCHTESSAAACAGVIFKIKREAEYLVHTANLRISRQGPKTKYGYIDNSWLHPWPLPGNTWGLGSDSRNNWPRRNPLEGIPAGSWFKICIHMGKGWSHRQSVKGKMPNNAVECDARLIGGPSVSRDTFS